MELMEGQYFSQTFRRAYPKFNGLIWAYHWLQVGLYEPLIEGTTAGGAEGRRGRRGGPLLVHARGPAFPDAASHADDLGDRAEVQRSAILGPRRSSTTCT